MAGQKDRMNLTVMCLGFGLAQSRKRRAFEEESATAEKSFCRAEAANSGRER